MNTNRLGTQAKLTVLSLTLLMSVQACEAIKINCPESINFKNGYYGKPVWYLSGKTHSESPQGIVSLEGEINAPYHSPPTFKFVGAFLRNNQLSCTYSFTESLKKETIQSSLKGDFSGLHKCEVVKPADQKTIENNYFECEEK